MKGVSISKTDANFSICISFKANKNLSAIEQQQTDEFKYFLLLRKIVIEKYGRTGCLANVVTGLGVIGFKTVDEFNRFKVMAPTFKQFTLLQWMKEIKKPISIVQVARFFGWKRNRHGIMNREHLLPAGRILRLLSDKGFVYNDGDGGWVTSAKFDILNK